MDLCFNQLFLPKKETQFPDMTLENILIINQEWW
jgi:hypothetical protein